MSEPGGQAGLWRRVGIALRRHELGILFGLGIGTIVLGYVGVWRHLRAAGELDTPFEILYQTLQIFSLGLGLGGEIPWELEIARFLGPTVLAMAGVKALLAIFEEQLEWVRARSQRRHVLICGLSDKGRHLALDFLRLGAPVVVVELDEGHDHVRALRDEGAIVLLGDAKDQGVLERAGAQHAKYVVASCGDDGTNVEIVVNANRLIREEYADEGEPVQCFVHVTDLYLLSQFKQQGIFTHTADRFEVRFFNLDILAARALFREDFAHHLARAGATEPVGLVVIGFGPLGQSVVVHAAHVAHFGSGTKTRIHVVDTDMDEIEPVFARHFPAIQETCELHYHDMDMRGPELLREGRDWAEQGLHAAVICLESDSLALSCALSLRSIFGGLRTEVFVDENAGLAAFLDDQGFAETAHISAFGTRDESCSPAVVVDEVQDTLAKAIHGYYTQLYGGDEWKAIPDYQKDSNRLAADHLVIKLGTVGCAIGESDASVAFTDDEVETLARMEHARWRAEKLLDGWIHGAERDDARKVHPDLVPWESLPAPGRQKNREAVRAIPDILRRIDRFVVRNAVAER